MKQYMLGHITVYQITSTIIVSQVTWSSVLPTADWFSAEPVSCGQSSEASNQYQGGHYVPVRPLVKTGK